MVHLSAHREMTTRLWGSDPRNYNAWFGARWDVERWNVAVAFALALSPEPFLKMALMCLYVQQPELAFVKLPDECAPQAPALCPIQNPTRI